MNDVQCVTLLLLQDVYPNSPATAAGLVPHKDYIVGTPDILFNDSEDLFTVVNDYLNKPLQVGSVRIRVHDVMYLCDSSRLSYWLLPKCSLLLTPYSCFWFGLHMRLAPRFVNSMSSFMCTTVTMTISGL